MTSISQIRAVTFELSQVHPQDFNVVKSVSFFAERGFNTLVVFAIGYLYGESYYPSEFVPPHEELNGRDLFGEIVEEAHRQGLEVFGYINGFFGGSKFFDPNPEWTQRWADGRETTQVRAKGLCPNSPYGRIIASAAAEICKSYTVDGIYLDEPSLQSWCACKFCIEKYFVDTSYELPKEALVGSENFARFLDWRTGVVASYVAEVGARCREAKPNVKFFAQHAFPLSSTSHSLHKHLFWGRTSGRTPPQFENWYRPSFYGQDISRVGEALDFIGIEPWRRFTGYPAWWQGACVSYARSAGRGKPVIPLMEYPHFPWGLGRLSRDELSVNCVDVISNGGELWWPMYAPGVADRGGWDALGELFLEFSEIRPVGFLQLATIALIASRTTAERYGLGNVDDLYLDDFLGTIQLVREMHLPYKVLMAETLTSSDLVGVESVVIASAACLSDAQASIIREFVEDGGHLLAQGYVGTHDENGLFKHSGSLSDVLGIKILQEQVHSGLGYLIPTEIEEMKKVNRISIRDELPRVNLDGATVRYEVTPSFDLFVPPSDGERSTAVTRHRWGKGLADFVGPQLGRLRFRFELFEARQIYEEIFKSLRRPIRGLNLGPQVGIHAWGNGYQTNIICVNMTSLTETGMVSTLSGQSVVVPAGSKVRSLRSQLLFEELCEGELKVTFDSLCDWDCIVING